MTELNFLRIDFSLKLKEYFRRLIFGSENENPADASKSDELDTSAWLEKAIADHTEPERKNFEARWKFDTKTEKPKPDR